MRLQRQWLTRVADTEAEAATKLGSFRFTRGTLVCCFTWPHVFMQVGVPGDNNCQFHALVDQLKQLRPQHHTDAFTLRNNCIDWLHANADMYMEVNH